MMKSVPMRNCFLLAILVLQTGYAASGDPLGQKFTQTVRPFVNKYCVGCHGGETPAAQLDLRGYSTIDSVVRDDARWATVLEKLSAKQMPPAQVTQPSDDARKQVVDWIRSVRTFEARKHAGDPGAVLARRLSNAEYNYTIRDLTGVDLRPTREFPVDPANTAGFDNSAESLTMSPALLKKYLQAAREVGDHMVLKPDSFDFAPYPMLVETDREKYAIQRIVNFYQRQPTDFADYFQACWRLKQKPGVTLARIAAEAQEAKLSPKYLPMVWRILTEEKDAVGPIARLQEMWRTAQTREQFVAMREFVERIRRDTSMQFAAPKVKGLAATSQPLMNWKLRAFAAHRRDFDPKALRMEGDPPPEIPQIPKRAGLGQEAEVRWNALTMKSRVADADLVVPTGMREQYEAAFAKFANVFPDAFYIRERGRFYPDDSEDKGRLLSAGYHNVMGYFRDDTPLIELILDQKGKNELDKLWDEFEFIGDYTTRTWIQYYFNQSGEVLGNGRESGSVRPSDKAIMAEPIVWSLREQYLTKFAADPANDPIAASAIREHFALENAELRRVEKMRVDAEPHHLEGLLRFAARAYRRPLSKPERDDLLANYHALRDKEGLTHEEAMRDSIVGVLMSPDFCYRLDLVNFEGAAGARTMPVSVAARGAQPLSAYALASRLSYFVWASMPDAELLSHAATGDLTRPNVLTAQVHRMLKDERAAGMATEFAGNWLDFRRFETINSVDRERFPSFSNELREAMFQEPVKFIEDMIRGDRPVLDLVYGNYTFVNPVLAKHYGMPEPESGADDWVRVDDAARYGRGGVLPMAVFLTENAPGLRTSPVKRGYWVVRRVLGEVIPPPPPVVPELPQDEAKSELPLRDMLAKHRENAVCGSCHSRFDAFGLAFEGYGPIGEARTVDLAGRPVDTNATFPGGAQGSGFEGVRQFIREHREKDFVDNLNRKLLAYALGRSLQLSDDLTIERMEAHLAASGNRFGAMIETIVTSPQFLSRRTGDPDALPARQRANFEKKKNGDNGGE
jgi:hypothetical protein